MRSDHGSRFGLGKNFLEGLSGRGLMPMRIIGKPSRCNGSLIRRNTGRSDGRTPLDPDNPQDNDKERRKDQATKIATALIATSR